MSKRGKTNRVDDRGRAAGARRDPGKDRKAAGADPAPAAEGRADLGKAEGKPRGGKPAQRKPDAPAPRGGKPGGKGGQGVPGKPAGRGGPDQAKEPGRKPKARGAAPNPVAQALIDEAEAEFRGITLPKEIPRRGENPHLGRPGEYEPKKLLHVLEQVSEGIPLIQVCREMGNSPNYSTVMRWAELSRRIMIALARARVEGFAVLELEMLQISRRKSDDWIETEKGLKFNGEAVQRSKLQIETLEKLLKVWNQERWTSVLRVQQDGRYAAPVDGGKGESPKKLSEFSTDELLAYLEQAAAEEANMTAGESDESDD